MDIEADMTESLYFNRDGSPMTITEWARKFESGGSRRVAEDNIGVVRVSTVWIGLNHNWSDGPPLIFETMIFGGDHDEHQERYSTEAQALEGHARAVALVLCRM